MRLVVLVLLALGFALAQGLECPTVYDGLSKIDVATQSSLTEITASWTRGSGVMQIEYAVVSRDLYSPIFEESCRQTAGFLGAPDVRGWTKASYTQTSVTVSGLNLEAHKVYIVVVRSTFKDGTQLYSNSNGVMVLPGLKEEVEEIPREHGERDIEATRAHVEFGVDDCCPIEQENVERVASDFSRVRDQLNEQYGEPVFSGDSFVAALYRRPITSADAAQIGVARSRAEENCVVQNGREICIDDDGDDEEDDDDDGFAGIGIVGIIFAVLALLCLLCALLLCVAAFVTAGEGDDDKFSEGVVKTEHDVVDADMGGREAHEISSDTRIEFPDIDPNTRLSHV